MKGNKSIPILILLLSQLAIGSAAILVRWGLASGLTPLSLAAWRLLIAACIVLVAAQVGKRPDRSEALSREERVRLGLAGICLALHFYTWFASLEYVSVARSTLLVTTSPIWSGLIGVIFLKQRLGGLFWAGMALACIGAWGVTLLGVSTHPEVSHGAEIIGDLLALGGALALALYFVLVDAIQKRQGTARTVAVTYSVAAISLWCALLLRPERATCLPANSVGWLAVVGMALLPQLVGHTALNWSLLHFPAGVVGVAMLLEPIFAGLLAAILFQEPVTGGQMVAAIVLLAGVAVVLRSSTA